MARRLIRLALNSHADFLLPLTRRWLKIGMNVTANAPDVIKKKRKSGTVKAAVYASSPAG